MNNVDKIKCPNCGTEINVNMALSNEIEAQLKSEYSVQNSRHLAEIEKLKKEKDDIAAKVLKEKEAEFLKRLETESDKIRDQLTKENEEGFKSLQKTIKEKTEQVIELNKTKAELEKIRMEKEEIEFKITAAKDAELSKKLKEERDSQKAFLNSELERIKKESTEENTLKMDELRKKLEVQTALAEEMQRKAE